MIFTSRVVYTSLGAFNNKAATQIVNNAKKFQSNISFNIEGVAKEIDAKNLNSIQRLNLKKGSTIEIVAKGKDENKAVESLVKFFEKMK
ncbi:hypothetical protein DICPUDRAFT_91798 [Dictyostelium purpureum]|uniref:Phosphocarrier protein HPr n=1 Tax=Dictyostelium purpureum TaxID=5786 RepID=F0ZH96_DICPU|nr:uncharacterized protein DICPUDRAFT_91798 [Dictyostelium purpureum]EGC36687.1 hypothetical protein DICPUDRAFT_91798 [Dictyostelium purpureum]|eukprot:XP_003286786.1 hypothetical protein DICPUDRAFT_91798 [Dictyostelium purpureum]